MGASERMNDPIGDLTALRGSIAKWEAIVAGTGEDGGPHNCPLCQRFPGCASCPVADEVGDTGCESTPYVKWFDHQRKDHGHQPPFDEPSAVTPGCEECVALAQAELDFLRSLLPDNRAG